MLHNFIKLAGASLLMATAVAASAQSDIYPGSLHDYRVVTVADDLIQPWSMAWLPGGDMLITEKPGRLRIVRNGQLLPEAVPGVPEVFYEGQGGLFDVRKRCRRLEVHDPQSALVPPPFHHQHLLAVTR